MRKRTLVAFAVIAVGLAAFALFGPRRPVAETDATTAPPAEFREVWVFDPPFAAERPAWLGQNYVSFDHPDGHAVLFALDRRTAKSAWSFDNNRKLIGFPGPGGVDPLFVSTGRSVIALSAKDGTPIWTLPVADNVIASPALVGGRVAVSAATAGVYLVEARTGNPVWHTTGIGSAFSPAATAAGKLFVCTHDELVALDESTGAVVWRTELTGSATDDKPLAGNGIVIATTGDKDSGSGASPNTAGVAAFDAETGRQKWFAPEYAGTSGIAPNLVTLSSPAWTKTLLYVGSLSGRVRAIDADAGQVVWATNVGSRIVGRPQHAWLYVFVVTEDGRIVVLDHQTGAAVGQFRIPGGGPVLAADAGPRTVVVAEADTPEGRRVRVLCYEYVK